MAKGGQEIHPKAEIVTQDCVQGSQFGFGAQSRSARKQNCFENIFGNREKNCKFVSKH